MGDYNSQLHQEIEARIETWRPLVEESFGSLPKFSIEASCFPSTTPWRIAPNFKDGTSRFRYYPRWIKKHSFLLNQDAAKSNNDAEESGYAAYSTTHELVHLYQIDPLKERLGLRSKLPYPILMGHLASYGDWLEGSAELATLHVGLSPHVTESPLSELLNTSCIKRLATVTMDLYMAGRITEPDIANLQLPFRISDDIQSRIDMVERKQTKKRADRTRYTRGLFYCARLASRTATTPAEILTTPFKNTELADRAR